ncbi:molybdopterin-binding protein [uncultured Paludibaculum sp.]|uniref:molybdopterin-binding protein n=1 Tax=uncultured Paludibaculum sp. TaxID=1765020 RepID=UPI002AAB9F76|nr:molybdopterin-binding protein [uncultured Paludibaculum sp.]
MRAQTIDVQAAHGRVLCCTIFRPGGKKLLAKGHLISEDDVRLLETEGMRKVWVTELDENEVGEDDAAAQVAALIGCGSLEIRLAAGGRANLIATENCSVLVDDELLKQINCAASVVIATTLNFRFARPGDRVATVKSSPFAVTQQQLDAVLSILNERGPILQARPIRDPAIAVLYTDPCSGDRARQLFESVMRQRLDQFGLACRFSLACAEEEDAVAKALGHLLRAKPTAILVASTTAPAGPADVIGRAMATAGCQLERFLAPVEPGNLLLLGYKDDVPVVSAPGCFRSAKTNVVDLILPPMLARYRVSGWEIAGLGHGGLLS